MLQIVYLLDQKSVNNDEEMLGVPGAVVLVNLRFGLRSCF